MVQSIIPLRQEIILPEQFIKIMSGKALEHPVVRISTAMKEWVEDDVFNNIKFKDIPMELPIALSGKSSHGDVDIVVSQEDWTGMFPAKVKEHKSRNGFSHAAWPIYESRECVQVDFIKVPKSCLQQAAQYYSHGTLGNHIGLLCRSIGLRYGFRGLVKRVNDPTTDQGVGYINISEDPYEILRLLGLSQSTIIRLRLLPFVDREQSYEVLKEFPWFRPEAMYLDNMTAANRNRERKRPETSNVIAWMNSGNCGFDWVLEDAFLNFAGKEEYRNIWQKTLLGRVMYKRIGEQSSALIQAHRSRKKSDRPMDDWFREVSAKTGLSGSNLSIFAVNMAKVLECKVSEIPNKLNNAYAETVN